VFSIFDKIIIISADATQLQKHYFSIPHNDDKNQFFHTGASLCELNLVNYSTKMVHFEAIAAEFYASLRGHKNPFP
jgi:hypothetical protein